MTCGDCDYNRHVFFNSFEAKKTKLVSRKLGFIWNKMLPLNFINK